MAPPDTVIMMDADCRVAEGALDRLTADCLVKGRAVEALYLMATPDGAGANLCVAEFALRVKNWVRPIALSALGLPCQLTGSGMPFGWGMIRSVNLGSGAIVEDMKLGLDLAQVRSAAVFRPSALVTSEFPLSAKAAANQRLFAASIPEAVLGFTRLPLLLSTLSVAGLPLSTGLAWLRFGKAVLPARTLARLPVHIFASSRSIERSFWKSPA